MRLNVHFGVKIPADIPLKDAREWITFVLGLREELSSACPFAGQALSVIPETLTVGYSGESSGGLLGLLEDLERTVLQRRTEAGAMAAEADDSWRMLAEEIASIRHGVLDSESEN